MISRSHHDLFEKLLQDMARIIAELMGSHTEDPLVALEQAKQHYLQLEENKLAMVPPEELLAHLLAKDFSHPQLEITARFLFAEGKVCITQMKPDIASRKLKQALVIYEYLEEHSDIYSDERRQSIKDINQLLVS